jgi:hypothetical protein
MEAIRIAIARLPANCDAKVGLPDSFCKHSGQKNGLLMVSQQAIRLTN